MSNAVCPGYRNRCLRWGLATFTGVIAKNWPEGPARVSAPVFGVLLFGGAMLFAQRI